MSKAIVALSGGLDSTVALFWSLTQYEEVRAVTVNYGQRHDREIKSAIAIAALADVQHEVVEVPRCLIGTSSLVNTHVAVPKYADIDALPTGWVSPTSVPARDAFLLSILANRAYDCDATTLVVGTSQVDSGGYPSCMTSFFASMQFALSYSLLGKCDRLGIAVPLIGKSKAEIVLLAERLGDVWPVHEALSLSHTCYDGAHPPCGSCRACILRACGFATAGVPDPLIGACVDGGLLSSDCSVYDSTVEGGSDGCEDEANVGEPFECTGDEDVGEM